MYLIYILRLDILILICYAKYLIVVVLVDDKTAGNCNGHAEQT